MHDEDKNQIVAQIWNSIVCRTLEDILGFRRNYGHVLMPRFLFIRFSTQTISINYIHEQVCLKLLTKLKYLWAPSIKFLPFSLNLVRLNYEKHEQILSPPEYLVGYKFPYKWLITCIYCYDLLIINVFIPKLI